MAGFEVVVRPVVLPDIRPAPAQSLPPADDPEKGFAVIRGNGGKHIDLSNSFSASTSSGGGHTETKRRVDETRVYKKEEHTGLSVDLRSYVDVDVPNKIWSRGPPYPSGVTSGAPVPEGTRPDPIGASRDIRYYARQEEAPNIQIMRRDVIKRNKESGE